MEHLLEFLSEELGDGLQRHACLLRFDNRLEVKLPAKCVVLSLASDSASLLRGLDPESAEAGHCCLEIMGWGSVS